MSAQLRLVEALPEVPAGSDELKDLEHFSETLKVLAPKAKWSSIAHTLGMLGVEKPHACFCLDPRTIDTWLHKNHGKYNLVVRHAIVAAGAREHLHAVFQREVREWNTKPEHRRIMSTPSAALDLVKFLAEKPERSWFE